MDTHAIAVVGGSLAALRTAEQLRVAGHLGPITVYSAERHPPYNRPPLSKQALADPAATDPTSLGQKLALRRRTLGIDVDFRFATFVESASLPAGTLTTAAGTVEHFDGLVAATGLRPRRLTCPGPTSGRYVLRTVEDCISLRLALQPGSRVVVVGGGFIGCESACTLSQLGHHVTVVEPAGAPLQRALGEELALAVQRHHEAAGIHFITGVGVTEFFGDRHVSGVLLSDGTVLDADVVIEAVGSVCNTEFLAGNDVLDLADGVLTDNHLAVVGASNAVAVGDLARFPNPAFSTQPRRVEHWSNAGDTAKRAALTLLAQLDGTQPDPEVFAPIPSFWSDQLDLRLQSFGVPSLGLETELCEGDLDRLGDGVLVSHLRDGHQVGITALNLSAARHRPLVESLRASVLVH